MTTKRFFVFLLACGLVPTVLAFDIVFDPQSYSKLVAQLAQMQQQYTELVNTYQMVTNQYQQMVANAQMITSKTRWKAVLTPWQFPNATNTYGKSAAPVARRATTNQ